MWDECSSVHWRASRRAGERVEFRLASQEDPGQVNESVDEEHSPCAHPDAAHYIGRVVPPEHEHGPSDADDDEDPEDPSYRPQHPRRHEEHRRSERRHHRDRARR